MPSRVTSIEELDWRKWIIRDYARYWYGMGLIALLVLGIGELARVGAPLDGAEVGALFVTFALVLLGGFIGYALVWHPGGPMALAIHAGGRRLLRLLRLRPSHESPNPASLPDDDRKEEGRSDEEHGGDEVR